MTMEFTRPRAPVWMTLLRMFGGAIVGGVSTWLYLAYARELRWADMLALLLAMVCMIGAVRLFGDSFNRQGLSKMLSLEGDASNEEVGQVRLQAAMMAVLGVSLIFPPLAAIAATPAPVWTYVIVVAALIANLWFTWRVYKQSDEYARHRMVDITFRSSLVGQSLLVAYAGAERLGLAPAMTAWEVMVALTAIAVVVPIFNPPPKAKL